MAGGGALGSYELLGRSKTGCFGASLFLLFWINENAECCRSSVNVYSVFEGDLFS